MFVSGFTDNPHQICLDKYDFELTDGLEMVLNTVTHRLAFVHKGTILTELRHVKGGKLYPFVMYVKDAYYPLELNYVEGPKGILCITFLTNLHYS